jgi:uncharacterized membrane protein YqjE
MATLDSLRQAEGAPEDPSIAVLVRRLVEDTAHLVRTELRLAQTELADNAKAMTGGVIAIAVGGTFLVASTLTLLAAIIGWLTPLVGAGWAAMIVTLAAATIGGGLILLGRSRIAAVDLRPKRALADAAAIMGEDTPKGPKP